MFQFTHPGRGATRITILSYGSAEVSIHAPREGCDDTRTPAQLEAMKFQFTHPGRGATPAPAVGATMVNVSIHAPREGCDSTRSIRAAFAIVSIHAPREGCDRAVRRLELRQERFNSRTPGGVRHTRKGYHRVPLLVSIHAPREGCDKIFDPFAGDTQVSIHAPREGCDEAVGRSMAQQDVSIHAPREGCDLFWAVRDWLNPSFNSRTPGGVRPSQAHRRQAPRRVSIHAPREGCDGRFSLGLGAW